MSAIVDCLSRQLRSRTVRYGLCLVAIGAEVADQLVALNSRSQSNTSSASGNSRQQHDGPIDYISLQELQYQLDCGQLAQVENTLERFHSTLPEDLTHWNYGNMWHQYMNAKGLVALHESELDQARVYLTLAGQAPMTPQLMSFGPNMLLAKKLLERGEYSIVRDYLELCRNFWADGSSQLQQWSDIIASEQIPDFGPNLDY